MASIFLVSGFRLGKLLIVEQLREPVGLFWSVIAPPLMFAFLNNEALGKQPLSVDWYVSETGWYLSYIAVTTSLFGFALYFVGRRESGFVRSFITGKKNRLLFIVSQFMSSVVLALLAYLFFMVMTAAISGVDILGAMGALLKPFMIALVLNMFGALSIAALPITFQNASSGISIFSSVMLILGIAGVQADPAGTVCRLNQFNPLYIWAGFISSGGRFSQIHFILGIVMVTLGGVGYHWFRVNPVWNRQ